MMITNRHVYLLGNSKGFQYWTEEKNVANAIVAQYKGYMCKKVKVTPELNKCLTYPTLIEEYETGLYMTSDEREYFYESFSQYLIDLNTYYLKKLISNVTYLKFKSDDKTTVFNIVRFLHIFNNYCSEHDIWTEYYEGDESDEDYDTAFHECPIDVRAAAKYFIKHVVSR